MALKRTRQYFPRRYNLPQQSTGDFQRGAAIGESMGKDIQNLSKAIALQKQNAVANQLLNTNWNIPRAQWVGGKAPAAGVNLAGSPPSTGGVPELQLRIAEAQKRQALVNQQSAIQARIAQTALRQKALAAAGQGSGRSVWQRGNNVTGGGTKSTAQGDTSTKGSGKYTANSYNPETSSIQLSNGQVVKNVPDSYNMLRADFDSQFGKGAYDKLQTAYQTATKDPKTGKYVLDTPNMKLDPDTQNLSILDKSGNVSAVIPASDLLRYKSRMNAIKVQNGDQPQNLDLPLANDSTFQPGSQQRPYQIKSNVDYKQLPGGTFYQMPDGSIRQKPAPGQQPQQTQQPSTTVDQAQTPAAPTVNVAPGTGGGTSNVTPSTPDSTAPATATDNAQPDNSMPAVTPIAQLPTQQDQTQVADVNLPNTGVVPTSDQDLLTDAITRNRLQDRMIG